LLSMNTKEKTDQGFRTYSSNNTLLFYFSLPKIVYQSSIMSIYLANNAPTREISIQIDRRFGVVAYREGQLVRLSWISSFFLFFLFLLTMSWWCMVRIRSQPTAQTHTRLCKLLYVCMNM
jgi:hypothetical protein